MVNRSPPFTKIPTLIGWDFFARIASVGAASGLGLVSASPLNPEFSILSTPLCSPFSLVVTSIVLEATSVAGAGLEAVGCGCQLL